MQTESVEICIRNVAIGTKAVQLAAHLNLVLVREGFSVDEGSLVLECLVQSKPNSPVTYAFVSRKVATAIIATRHNGFRGRQFSAEISKSRKVQQPVAGSPGFGCLAFQLCAEWPPNELTCLWEATSRVSFQVRGWCFSADRLRPASVDSLLGSRSFDGSLVVLLIVSKVSISRNDTPEYRTF